MSSTRPDTLGGAITVSDSKSLSLLEIEGLPPGTLVWNEDEGAYFKLTTCARRDIDLDPTDGYAAGVWTFANGDFTDSDEGDTLVVALSAPNGGYNGNYFIVSVDSATEITVSPAPSGTTTAPLAGAITVVDTGPHDGEFAVSVEGGNIFGVVWRLFTAGGGGGDVVADGVTIDGEGTELSPLSSLGPRAWTRVDVVADVQDLDIAWVGATGYSIEIIGVITGGQAADDAVYTVQPNAVATGQVTQAADGQTSTAGAFKTTDLVFAYTPDPGGFAYARVTFVTAVGGRRPMFGQYLYETAGGASQFHASFVGRWSDTSTAITSIRIHGNVAEAIGAGSYFLYRSIPLTP